MSRGGNRGGSLTGGLILMAIGTAFLLERYDVVSMRRIWRLWPMILIWLGLMNLVYPKGGRRSIFLLLIGVWLQISVFELWGLDFGDSWPLLIIFLGASFIFDSMMSPGPLRPRRRGFGTPTATAAPAPDSTAHEDGASERATAEGGEGTSDGGDDA